MSPARERVSEALEDQAELEDEMTVALEAKLGRKRFEPRRVIRLSPEEFAGLEALKADPQPATPEARAAYVDYLRFTQED